MAQQDAIKSVTDSDPDEEDPWGPDEDDDDDDCSGTPPMTKIVYLRPKIFALQARNSKIISSVPLFSATKNSNFGWIIKGARSQYSR